MTEVGSVSVKVTPDARGFQRALARQINAQKIAFRVGDASAAGKDGAVYARSFQRAANTLFKNWAPSVSSKKIRAMGAAQGAQYAMAFKAAVGTIDVNVDVDRNLLDMMRARKVRDRGRRLGETVADDAARGLAEGVTRQMAALSQKGGFAGAAKGIAGVGAALAATAATAYVGAKAYQAWGKGAQYALEQSGQLEQTTIALTTLLGSQEKAAVLLGESIEFSKETPFDLPAVTQGVRQLKAYGFAAKDLIPLMTDIGDSAAALGIGPEGIQRLILALGQIKARGAFRADEARQLTEAGIPAWKALARALTEAEGNAVSVQEVMKRAEAGQISAKFALAALRGEMQRSFGGSMQKQALTFLGTVEKVKDSLNIGLQTTLQGALPGFSKTLQDLLPSLEKLSFKVGGGYAGGLQGFVQALSGTDFEDALDSVGDTLRELIAELGPKFGQLVGNIAIALEAWAPAIRNAVDSATTLLSVMTKVGGGIGEVLSGAGDFTKSLGPANLLLGPFGAPGIAAWLGEFFEDDALIVDKAQAKVTALGAQLKSELTAIDPNFEKLLPTVDFNALERGNLNALKSLQTALQNDPRLANWFDIDTEELQSQIDSALDGLDSSEYSKVKGFVEFDLDVGAAEGQLDKRLRGLAAKAVKNRNKLPVDVEIDFAALQDGQTATSEIDKLLKLDRNTFAKVFDIDTSKVTKVKNELREISRFQTFRPNFELGISPEKARTNLQTAMRKILDKVDLGKKEVSDILVGAKINPQSLAKFQPGALKKTLGLSNKELVEVGFIPKASDGPGFRRKVLTILSAGGGTSVPVDIEPNTEGGQPAQLFSDELTGLLEDGGINIDLTVNTGDSATQVSDITTKATEFKDGGPYKSKMSINDQATTVLETGINLQTDWDDLDTDSSHVIYTRIVGPDPKNPAGGGGGDQGPDEKPKPPKRSLVFPASPLFRLRRSMAGPVQSSGGSTRSGDGGVGVTGSSGTPSFNLNQVINKLDKGTLYGAVVIKRVKKFAKQLTAAIAEVNVAASGVGKMPPISSNGEFGKYAASLEQQAAELDKAAFALQTAQTGVARAEEKLTSKIGKIENAASKRARQDKDFNGRYKFTKKEKQARKALKKELGGVRKRGRALDTESEKQRLAREKVSRQQAKVEAARQKKSTEWTLDDIASNAMGQDAETLTQQLTDLKRAAELGEYEGFDLRGVTASIDAAIAEANRLDGLRKDFAEEDILSSAADSVKSGDWESIQQQLTDLSRQQQLGELDIDPAQYNAVVQQLDNAVSEARKTAKADLLKGLFDPRAVRDLSNSAGVKSWVQSMQDSLADLQRDNPDLITEAQTAQMRNELNAQQSLIESHVAKLERIAEARDFKKAVEDAWLGSADANTRSPRSLTRRLRAQTDVMKNYQRDIMSLSGMGLTDAAAKYLAEMDPATAAKFASRLLAGGSGAIAEFNSALEGYQGAADLLGETAAGAAFTDTGVAAGQGFIDGLESKESAIRAAMEGVAEGMLAAWKKALGIASPSKLFAAEAAWIGAGIVKGVDGQRANVEKSMATLYALPARSTYSGIRGAAPPAGGATGDINIDVHPRETQDEVAVARAVARELAWSSGR